MGETAAKLQQVSQTQQDDAQQALNKDPVSILVVDDLPEKLLAYEAILEELGQNLVTVRSGEEALRLLLKQEFAVILLDVNMPGMDGFETASLIRKRKKSSHTPIIFLTAFTDEIRMAQGYASGAVDYLPTPVVPEVLKAKVRVFIEMSQMRRQAALQAEERAMRKAAEESARRSEFLSTASDLLSRPTSPLEILSTIGQLPIPFLADTSILWVDDEQIQKRWLGIATYDGEHVSHSLVNPPELSAFPQLEKIMQQVAHGGQLKYIAKLPTSALLPLPSDTLVSINNESDNCPALLLPFTIRAQSTKGVLLLSRCNAEHGYTPNDISLAIDLVARATAALENALLLDRIQEADRRKNEFLATLAHELRNPLAPIRNALQVMKMSDDKVLCHEAEQTIERQVAHMVHLVEDLMDVSRITQGKIELRREPVSLRGAIGQAVETAQPLIKLRNHNLSVSMPDQDLWLDADFSRISQIFANLLNNAAKYTDDGGDISISAKQENGEAVICVRDNGLGVPAEMLPKIFDLFQQVDGSLERAQGGLGIGLTLVRNLVEMHGGTIDVYSQGLGKGSEFTVRLPMAEVPGQEAAVQQDCLPGKASQALQVLVVDDNEASAKTLGWMMELAGHQAHIAHDGISALQHAQENPPDVVLLDIGLPGMNGYDVCKAMHKIPSLKNTVFIAQTGWGQAEHRQRSKEAQFDHHLVKPIDLTILQQLLDEIGHKPAAS